MTKATFTVLAMMMTVTTAAGCADPVEDVETEEQGETNSELAGNARTDQGDAAVVGILYQPKGSTGTLICTGSVIAPKVVLTAGHCTAGGGAGKVFVGTSASAATESVAIAKFVPHPGYDAKTKANDIGIVVLAKPLTTVKSLAVNRKPLESLVDPNGPAPTVKMVGYGATARTANSSEGVGTKRVGLTLMRKITPKEFYVSASADIGGSTACGGDSGGPAFLKTSQGWLLIGTESRGDVECKVGTNKVRTDAVIDFIDRVVAANK